MVNHWLGLISSPKPITLVEIAKVRIRGARISQEEITANYTKLITELMSDGNQRMVKEISHTIGAGDNWVRKWLSLHCVKDGKLWSLKK